MDVDRDLHYVADGLITHNCWYAMKKTGKWRWAGDRKQTTLWQIASRDQDATRCTARRSRQNACGGRC